MTTVEIKKALYKEKPIAEYSFTTDGFKIYSTEIVVDGFEEEVTFKVPEHEATGFGQTEPAQLLIRWINE